MGLLDRAGDAAAGTLCPACPALARAGAAAEEALPARGTARSGGIRIESALAEEGRLGILRLRLADVYPGEEAATSQHQGKDDTAHHNQDSFHDLLSFCMMRDA
jgi:hypothetical protein